MLFHGLEGSTGSPYAQAFGAVARPARPAMRDPARLEDLPNVGPAVAALLRNVVANPATSNAPDFLTDREREVLVLIAEGQSNKEIANKLGIGVRTIETHRERIMRRLDIHSVAGLTKYAIAHELTAAGGAAIAAGANP